MQRLQYVFICRHSVFFNLRVQKDTTGGQEDRGTKRTTVVIACWRTIGHLFMSSNCTICTGHLGGWTSRNRTREPQKFLLCGVSSKVKKCVIATSLLCVQLANWLKYHLPKQSKFNLVNSPKMHADWHVLILWHTWQANYERVSGWVDKYIMLF